MAVFSENIEHISLRLPDVVRFTAPHVSGVVVCGQIGPNNEA